MVSRLFVKIRGWLTERFDRRDMPPTIPPTTPRFQTMHPGNYELGKEEPSFPEKEIPVFPLS